MTDELLDLSDIAALYRCTRRHARDVITKAVGFPEIAPGSTTHRPLYLRVEVRAYLHRKPAQNRTNPEFRTAAQ